MEKQEKVEGSAKGANSGANNFLSLFLLEGSEKSRQVRLLAQQYNPEIGTSLGAAHLSKLLVWPASIYLANRLNLASINSHLLAKASG